MNEPTRLNIPEWTVSELSAALKKTVEDAFGYVRVRGEISGFRGAHSSGHCYFALKDEGAKIDAVIWRSALARMRIKPEEGLEVLVTGRLTTYPGKSTYQIVIETLAPAGIGALMALVEERKKKLAAEGLFEAARKQLLPFLPERIGVVTSPTGAVIRDILHRLADRFPRHVIVWPVRVQGDGCAEEVAAAIHGFNALPLEGPMRRPDLLIVARGGGSLEDLWSFNEEIVVRAAAASMIPLIAAVGHETDVTLIDFAADVRAPTPSAAAELAVPVRMELAVRIESLARRSLACWQRGQEARCGELRAASRALPTAEGLLALPRRPRGFGPGADLSVAGADGGFAVAAADAPCASAGTWPSENSMSICMPALTALACRSGRPPPSRTSAKPRASTPRWESALSSWPQCSTEAARWRSEDSSARRDRAQRLATRSHCAPMRPRCASAFARKPAASRAVAFASRSRRRSRATVSARLPRSLSAMTSSAQRLTRPRKTCGPSRPATRAKRA